MNFRKLGDFLDKMVSTGRTPGCAVAVYKDGKPVYTYAAGVSDIESGERMTGEEYFNIYSCSKITTVTAGAQLIEKGIINLNDPLYEYIPEYREMTVKTPEGPVAAKNPIKVGDLFTMTTGFNYDFNAPSLARLYEETGRSYTTADLARAMAGEPLSFEPGTKWQYSMSHDCLGGLISIVTGMPFSEYVKRNIFDPLNMTETVYHTTPEIEARTASQYTFVANDPEQQKLSMVEAQIRGNAKEGYFKNVGKAKVGGHGLDPNFDSGGGGLISTVGDYVKLMNALSCGGLGATGERILSSRTVEMMKANRLNSELLKCFTWKQLAGYGYGLGMRTHIDPAASGSIANLGEFGWGGAAGATAVMDTKERLGAFFAQHTLNPREEWYQPRLRDVIYSCID